ncbi:MAG: gliding motility protein GldN [Candidatus Symbiothrix sp.]|jgi:gliding motility associated protien GldN|nr:gliding motility protein GldN [Candidatus Symbiothrix sp.]
MKRIYYISLAVALVTLAQSAWAQEQPRRATRQRPSEAAAEASSVANLTERAKIKHEQESKKPAHIVWERIIYRMVDLMKEESNAALYYPVQPMADRQNLFTLVFKLLSDGKITAYNYLEGGEVFTEAQKKDFEEVLKKLQILYTKQGNSFVVDERDIPGQEITQYMIKEGYYFDQATGTFQTEVLAICPILVREDFYYGNATKEALFWLQYDDLRPYLSREMIMTSNYNNALTYTMEDYFRKTLYQGEIVKTVNMMGKSLAGQVGNDPEALKHAQDSIEAQLKGFNQQLWIFNDTIVAPQEATKKPAKTVTAKTETVKPAKAPKPKSSTKTEPTRSVRRN